MSALSKRKKHSKGFKVRQCEDRITNLPSCLITKILSCLPTTDAVATSVLSKNWKLSWTSVTNLDFRDYKIRSGYLWNSHWDTPAYRKFTNFVTRMLLQRDRSCLQRISIHCHHNYDDSLVNAWLIVVSRCNVQELDVSIPIKHPGLLPSDLFLCNRLVVLKLNVKGYVMPFPSCLPDLKTLHINGVQLPDDVSITGLLSGCPLLEELNLSECIGKDVRVININARVLKRLTIAYLPYEKPADFTNVKYQMMIDTPSLEHLKFSDYIARFYVVNNMDHLISAEVDVDSNGDHFENDQFGQIYSEALKNFLHGISQVRNLVLSWSSTVLIGLGHVALPKFSNLTYLKLNILGGLLPEFLENSPCLRALFIEQEDEVGNLGTFALHNVPSCFLFHLKEIEIREFTGREDEMEVVEHILKNAKVLKSLTLIWPETLEDDDAKCLKTLLSLPRASTRCKILVD